MVCCFLVELGNVVRWENLVKRRVRWFYFFSLIGYLILLEIVSLIVDSLIRGLELGVVKYLVV